MLRYVEEAAARGLSRILSPAGRRGRLAVFCYHQVVERTHALRKQPDSGDFGRDIEVIARVFTVLPLREAARRMVAGTLPRCAACITFDDGYADNHALAAPILERAGVPATFFVTGGAVDDGIMWNDIVIEAIAQRRGPPVFHAVPEFAHTEFDGDEAALVAKLLGYLKYQPLAERRSAAERFFRDNVGDRELPRLMMSRDMVADLACRGFDIGGHTMNHPILSRLSEDGARQEIDSGSRWLKSVTGARPKSFAYPNGKPEVDFTARHAEMAAEAGYEVAVTTEWDLARGGTDVYRIPRVGPWWRERPLTEGLLRLYGGSILRSRRRAA